MYVQVGTSTQIWYVVTKSEVADTEGSTATGAPLKKSETGKARFCLCPHTTTSLKARE